VLADSLAPSRIAPVTITAGGVTLDGGSGSTVVLASASAVAKPTMFVAVTVTAIRFPASALTSRYVLAVAPAMAVQSVSAASQRDHAYVNEIGTAPLHVPGWAVSLAPTATGPAGATMRGTVSIPGGTVWISAVAADIADDVPMALVLVTTTRSAACPSSSVSR
jgi:hypothetical protein